MTMAARAIIVIEATMLALMLVMMMMMMIDLGIADPVLAPELRHCNSPVKFPEQETPFNCCAPNWDKPAIDFQFDERAWRNLKVRRPAHTLDAEYAAKVDKAYGLMKGLPTDDPRSFVQQANIHCAYCCATYVMGNTSTPFQVHESWLFFSFHRWYIYFHERILGALLGDDNFALPFWNYDHPDGMTVPNAYMVYPNLFNLFRELTHLPPSPVVIDYFYVSNTNRSTVEQMDMNLATIYRGVVSGVTNQFTFFGQPYRQGDPPQPGFGNLEAMPHNSVHSWLGDRNQIGWKDMGTFYAAARDPVFYTHHASLDRLWEVWKSLGNDDIDDPDYLNSEFVFYNEKAELVKVKVKDSLDTFKLGYMYEEVENLWLDYTTKSLSDGVASLTGSETMCVMGEEMVETCSIVIKRDKEGALRGEEMLVIGGIVGVLDSAAHFDAYVNLPHASLSTMINCTEFAGRFSMLPQMVITDLTGNYFNTSAQFAIGNNIRELGLGEEDSLIVTLVPVVESPYYPVTISSINLHYETQGLLHPRQEGGLMQRMTPHSEKPSTNSNMKA